MKPRTIITLALVIFLCATAAYLILDEARSRSGARQAEKEQLQQGEAVASSKESEGTTINPSGPKKEQTAASGQVALEQQKQVSAPSKQTAAPVASQSASSRSVSPQSIDSKSSDSQKPDVTPTQKVLAYYFHGTQRCPTCMKLEAYSAEAVERGFGDALKQGRLEWRVVNVDEPLNKHFTSDYQLYTKSLVIVKMQGGKQAEWKNLEKIWELVGDKDDFIKYVQEEVSAYLGVKQ